MCVFTRQSEGYAGQAWSILRPPKPSFYNGRVLTVHHESIPWRLKFSSQSNGQFILPVGVGGNFNWILLGHIFSASAPAILGLGLQRTRIYNMTEGLHTCKWITISFFSG